MKKYMGSIIACVVLIGGLVGLYMFNEAQKAGEENGSTPSPATQTALIALPAAEVVRLETVKDGLVSVLVKDAAGAWRLEHSDAPIAYTAVTGLINGICNATAEVLREDAGDLAGYGFTPATAIHTVTLADGTAATLRLGGLTPAQDAYYAMIDGFPTLYLMNIGVAAQVNRGLAEVLDKEMMTVTAESVEYMTFQVRGQSLVHAEKNPADEVMLNGTPYTPLKMVSPVSGKDIYMDPMKTYLVEPLADIALETFVCEATPENLTLYGFDDPALTLVFEGAAEQAGMRYRYHLAVGNDVNTDPARCYVLYEGIPYIFTTDAAVLKTMAGTSALQLVDRFVSFVIITTVDSITVDSRERGVTHEMALTHSTETAATGDPRAVIAPVVNGQPVQDAAFRDFYGALGGMSFDLLAETFEPTGEPALVITYRLNTGAADVVDAYYEYDNNFYIIAKGDTGALLMNKQYVNGMLDAVDDLLVGKLDE